MGTIEHYTDRTLGSYEVNLMMEPGNIRAFRNKLSIVQIYLSHINTKRL